MQQKYKRLQVVFCSPGIFWALFDLYQSFINILLKSVCFGKYRVLLRFLPLIRIRQFGGLLWQVKLHEFLILPSVFNLSRLLLTIHEKYSERDGGVKSFDRIEYSQ